MLIWDDDGPDVKRISMEPCDWFSARGMKRIYGRSDVLTSQTFNMDIWRHKSGRIFARF